MFIDDIITVPIPPFQPFGNPVKCYLLFMHMYLQYGSHA